jgi:hypothetical protein
VDFFKIGWRIGGNESRKKKKNFFKKEEKKYKNGLTKESR